MALRLKPEILLFGFLVLCSTTLVPVEPSTCSTVYKVAGSSAVLESPECPQYWKLQDYETTTSPRCQIAMLKGRRDYQDDRTLCSLDLSLPFPGKKGTKEVPVGVVAVFDGHNGAEASDMASRLFLDYFPLHTHFLSEEKRSLASRFDDSYHLEILKEALLRTVHDIDVAFSKEASMRDLISGSAAAISLMVDGNILGANIGDSKAFLCSEKILSPEEARITLSSHRRERRLDGNISPSKNYGETLRGITKFMVKDLTKDHHPPADRDDEKMMVEAANDGYVLNWAGVPRIKSQLPHSIGDISYKSEGVISTPEIVDWQPLMAKDKYLVATSDGIFEKMSMEDACDLLWDERANRGASSLAGRLVYTAFEKGSIDNLSAIVIPLQIPTRTKESRRDEL